MKDFKNILENLEIPEFNTTSHQEMTKKQLLNSFEKSKESSFLKGGENTMFIKSKGLFGKFGIGAIVLLLALVVMTGFNPFNVQRANAQDVAKRALAKVSQLSDEQKEKFGKEKEKLEKALNAKNLSISVGASGNIRVLKFTDENGVEESIEIDDDDLPIVGNPSVTPTPSGSEVSPSASVSPSISPSPTSRIIRIDDDDDDDEVDDENEEVKGVNTESQENSSDSESEKSESDERED